MVEGAQTPRPGYHLTFQDSLHLILKNIITLVILPPKLLTSSFPLPSGLRAIGQATLDFKSYMRELVDEEREATHQKESGTGHLITTLIRALDNVKGSDNTVTSTLSLSEAEVYGNIFIYNLAGHETTANSVLYAIALLAAYPEWQNWVSEEIDLVFNNESAIKASDYETAFPRLKRCLAIMVCLICSDVPHPVKQNAQKLCS